ncbi:alpha-ribazole kinase [Desulfotomaculum arcticum]|uniref:Alpha-ribazole kinase n=2 Tax=Desulfotruncus TaxID=2867377 RepID=A0A1I2Z433_9FIRM|nr:alpha-ribazole kinase [Desulfotomaculum arcticum] [Desulfotruncus arcticus DSM 17038]
MSYMGRDVEVVPLDDSKHMVAACDSCGAVGSKDLDVVKVSNYIVGRFTARVALLEVLATGARPVLLAVTSANEPYPTTKGILQGVRDELKALDLTETQLAITSEKNMPTRQTGLGITAIGVCAKEALRVATSRPGDDLYCLGLPKVGAEVVAHDDPEIVQGQHILALLASPGVHDIIPVGSRGIRREAESLALQTGCGFKQEKTVAVNLNKSAGPSTCLIFTCNKYTMPPHFPPTPLVRIGGLQYHPER